MRNKKIVTRIISGLLVCTLVFAAPVTTYRADAAISTSQTMVVGSAKSSTTLWIQRDLNVLGYNCGTADGYYGNNTANGVRAFQSRYGLAVDGKAGPKTIAKINEVAADLQRTLNAKGFGSLTVDSLLGSASVSAINRAKAAMELSQDGVADESFRSRLASYGTESSGSTSSSTSSSLVNQNISNVNYIKQGYKTCKATSLAMALRIITGTNNYTTSGMGGSSCKGINGNVYTGSDGATYKATYKTDGYVGSASEQKAAIERAMDAGVPIVVAVHKIGSGTQHHWIVFLSRNGSTYNVVDPARTSVGSSIAANVKTLSELGYTYGLTNYSTPHYGYITFTKQ